MKVNNISQENYNIRYSKPQKVNLLLQFRAEQDSFISASRFSYEEEKQYAEILVKLPYKSMKKLDVLRRNGILQERNSNDGTSTLENLHRILSEKRAKGLTNVGVLQEAIDRLENPYTITQKSDNSRTNVLDAIFDFNNSVCPLENSGTCTASCIEFDLAHKAPAEFTRFVAGLTSEKLSVEKEINMENLADNVLDGIWLLNTFKTPKVEDNFKTMNLTLKPDENILFKIKLNNQSVTPFKKRSNVDTILQSTFMNVGSEQSYNSLTDMRSGIFNVNRKGLIEFEKTFVESVVRDKNIISVNYQKIADNGEIVGYEADFATMKQQLLDALEMKQNVILGLTNRVSNGNLKGHELVLVGAKTHQNGKTDFYCYNSNSDSGKPVFYSEDYFLPHIHHAGLPKEVVVKNMVFKEGWQIGLENYKQSKVETV